MGYQVFVEAVLCQFIFTLHECELTCRHEREEQALGMAVRAVALNDGTQVRLNLIPNLAAMTSPGIFLHNIN